jgi:L-iditol 2-dehydrogenase
VHLGAPVVVVGAGPIGLLLVQLLQVSGAGPVTVFEPLPHRRAAAAALGAAVADPAQAADPGALRAMVGEGAAVAFEIAGSSEAVQLAMAATWAGGRVVLGGIPDDDTTTFRAAVARRKGLTIAMVRRMNEVYPRAIALAASKKVDLTALVTDRYPLEDAAAAFSHAARRTGLKVIIEPTVPGHLVGASPA